MPFNCSGNNNCDFSNITPNNCITPDRGRIRFVMFIKKKYLDLICDNPLDEELYLNLICSNYALIITNVRGSIDSSENTVSGYGYVEGFDANSTHTLNYFHPYIEEYNMLYEELKQSRDYVLIYTTEKNMWLFDTTNIRVSPKIPVTDDVNSIVEMSVTVTIITNKLPQSLPILGIFNNIQCLYERLRNHTCNTNLLPDCPPLPPPCPTVIGVIYNVDDITITLNVFDPEYTYSYIYNGVETPINTNPFTFTYQTGFDNITIKRNRCPDLNYEITGPTCCPDGVTIPELTGNPINSFIDVKTTDLYWRGGNTTNITMTFKVEFDIESITNQCCRRYVTGNVANEPPLDYWVYSQTFDAVIYPDQPNQPYPHYQLFYDDVYSNTNIHHIYLDGVLLYNGVGELPLFEFKLELNGCCNDSVTHMIPVSFFIDLSQPVIPDNLGCCNDTTNFMDFKIDLANIVVTNNTMDVCDGRTVTWNNVLDSIWCPGLLVRVVVAFDRSPITGLPLSIYYDTGIIVPPTSITVPINYTLPGNINRTRRVFFFSYCETTPGNYVKVNEYIYEPSPGLSFPYDCP